MTNKREQANESRLTEVDYFADAWASVYMDIAEKLRADNPQTTLDQATAEQAARRRSLVSRPARTCPAALVFWSADSEWGSR